MKMALTVESNARARLTINLDLFLFDNLAVSPDSLVALVKAPRAEQPSNGYQFGVRVNYLDLPRIVLSVTIPNTLIKRKETGSRIIAAVTRLLGLACSPGFCKLAKVLAAVGAG